MSQSPLQCPRTPPPKHVARFPSFGNVTPTSSKCHKKTISDRLVKFPSTPAKSPFLSPRSSKKRAKDLIDPHNDSTYASSVFLPTPLTVGTGRKIKTLNFALQPSTRSKSLTATLQALSLPKLEESPSFLPERPSTPPLKMITAEMREHNRFRRRNDAESDDEDDIQVVDFNFVRQIPRHRMDNPFLGPKHSVQPTQGKIDYSTHTELINHLTGERKVQELTEEQRLFKPRKLVFTQDVKPVKVNYNIANKFIGKNIGKSFAMGEPQSALGFSIFNDEDEE